VGGLKVVGDVYIGLLQMTVLPYIVVALIGNIAKLSVENGKRLAWTGFKVMLALWAIGLLAVPLFALSFPTFDSGSFFSVALVERPEPIDYVGLYVPSNPFRALAENLVPAVVVFCILAGVAAIGMPRKQGLISTLDFVQKLLLRMKTFAVALTPYGIFAISAAAAGTMSAKEFGLLQGYLITHTAAVAVLCLWVLPMLVATVTPLRFRDVLRASWPPIVTAFVTGSTFVVLPMIVDGAKELLERSDMEPEEGSPDVVVPLGYPFPSLGKLLSILFIPFAAWFFGTPLLAADYPGLLGLGFLSSFGSVVVMIPSLAGLRCRQRDAPVRLHADYECRDGRGGADSVADAGGSGRGRSRPDSARGRGWALLPRIHLPRGLQEGRSPPVHADSRRQGPGDRGRAGADSRASAWRGGQPLDQDSSPRDPAGGLPRGPRAVQLPEPPGRPGRFRGGDGAPARAGPGRDHRIRAV
ncbi:MAG: cation:dicarboxylate symporter family transporter, partial [Planctomycetota bacterium]